MPDDQPPASDEFVLIDWLKNRDAACPLCAYNIRGLTTARCPECGQALRLSVALAEPYLKAWIALIAGLLLPAGLGLFLIIGLLNTLAHEGLAATIRDFFNPVSFSIWFALLHTISCVPLSAAAIIFRRRFLSWRRSTQITCAVIALISCVFSGCIAWANMFD